MLGSEVDEGRWLDVGALWHLALDDAGVDAGDAILIPIDCAEVEGNGYTGKTWLRGSRINDPADLLALAAAFDLANSTEQRHLARVAVCTNRSSAGLLAAMRHELEHSLQLSEIGGRLQELHGEAFDVLVQTAGGLPGSNELYNRIPMEADANGAGSRLARRVFGNSAVDRVVERADADIALLSRQPPPQPIETLPARMVQFIALDGPALAREFRSGSEPSG